MAELPEPPAWLISELDALTPGVHTSSESSRSDITEHPISTGQRNGTLARMGGPMRRVGMSQGEILAALLQANADRCQPPLPPREVELIASSVARYAPGRSLGGPCGKSLEQMYVEKASDEGAGLTDPGTIPEQLWRVPGFINAVIDYTLQTAPYPEPVLAFCGALSLQALLAGRKVRDASDNRTNLYLLGLANSGAGKDYPRKVNQRILLDCRISGGAGGHLRQRRGDRGSIEHASRRPLSNRRD